MIRIAVCDDKPNEVKNTEAMVREYLDGRSFRQEIALSSFSSPEDLLSEAKTEQFSILILDILMPEKDGVTLAREILSVTPSAKIIFLSTTSEFVYDAFSIQAVHYLVKPCTKEQMAEALDRAFDTLLGDPVDRIVIKNGVNEMVSFDTDRFLYAESFGRKTKVRTLDPETDGTVLNFPLNEVYALFSDRKQMARYGVSGFLNLENIVTLEKNAARLRNGDFVFIPRRVYQEFKNTYMDYYRL